jgi:uncharacterized protein YprB with RNaseH-like and TPR domain
MIEDQLRRRLESLNRAPLPPINANAFSIGAPSTTSHAKSSSSGILPMRQAPALLLHGEVVETAAGEHWRVRQPLDAIWQGGEELVAARRKNLQSRLAMSQETALPDRAIVLDLETCGLAGAALFLVGMLRQIDGAATIELLLARNYAEEATVLESLWQIVAGQDVLVTFNGRTFDWPMVLERSIRHRLKRDAERPLHHIDVLHHARRRWRKQLPNCRLQTLERHICRRHRPADIPGHAIPGVYADYVRTGFERDMNTVLCHNAADLVTLLDLALRLAA